MYEMNFQLVMKMCRSEPREQCLVQGEKGPLCFEAEAIVSTQKYV